jgi:hypothetical protein
VVYPRGCSRFVVSVVKSQLTIISAFEGGKIWAVDAKTTGGLLQQLACHRPTIVPTKPTTSSAGGAHKFGISPQRHRGQNGSNSSVIGAQWNWNPAAKGEARGRAFPQKRTDRISSLRGCREIQVVRSLRRRVK